MDREKRATIVTAVMVLSILVAVVVGSITGFFNWMLTFADATTFADVAVFTGALVGYAVVFTMPVVIVLCVIRRKERKAFSIETTEVRMETEKVCPTNEGYMTSGHIHFDNKFGTGPTFGTVCVKCGARICQSRNPETGNGCTLSEGHSGPHMNEWTKDGESWEGR
jgi:hypothetical protein